MEYLCTGNLHQAFYEDVKGKMLFCSEDGKQFVETSVWLQPMRKHVPGMAKIVMDKMCVPNPALEIPLNGAIHDMLSKTDVLKKYKTDLRRKVYVRFYFEPTDWIIKFVFRDKDFKTINLSRRVFEPRGCCLDAGDREFDDFKDHQRLRAWLERI